MVRFAQLLAVFAITFMFTAFLAESKYLPQIDEQKVKVDSLNKVTNKLEKENLELKCILDTCGGKKRIQVTY